MRLLPRDLRVLSDSAMTMPPLHSRIESAIESVPYWTPLTDVPEGHYGYVGKSGTWTFKIVRSEDCDCGGVAETTVCGFGTMIRLKPDQIQKAFECAGKTTA